MEREATQAALLDRYASDTAVRRVRWSGGETQVFELGDGPPLVLLHGGGDAAFEWVPLLPSLARHHRVFAVDRPGHGQADPFDYRGVDLLKHARTFVGDILDALELESADIAANSMGGLWATAFAIDFPERVSRLALIGAPPGVIRWVPPPLRLFGLPLVGRQVGRLMLSNPTREGMRKFWGQILVAHPERLDDTLLDVDVTHMRRNRDSIVGLLAGAVGVTGLRRELVLGDRWKALDVPTAFVYGEDDAFMVPRMHDGWAAIAAANPAVRLISIPGAGHLPWLDEPDRVVTELELFLTSQTLARRSTA